MSAGGTPDRQTKRDNASFLQERVIIYSDVQDVGQVTSKRANAIRLPTKSLRGQHDSK